MTWFAPPCLDAPSPFLLGALEVSIGGLVLELRLERFEEGEPSVGVWTEEWGRLWAVEVAGQA